MEDEQTLEAALSFLDEFFNEREDGGLSSAIRSQSLAAQVNEEGLVSQEPLLVGNAASREASTKQPVLRTNRCKIPLQLEVSEAVEMKRKKVNERKKLLRKTGVYGDPNRARNARRLEIAYLRDQIEKLEGDIQILQGQKSGKRANSTQKPTTGTIIPTMWQTIADSQRKRREGSELENVRLKIVIDRQQRMADSLRSLLQKRATQLASECTSFMGISTVKPHNVHVLDIRGDVTDFEALVRLNEAAYREVDTIFADNGLANMVISPGDVHIREGVGGKFIELFANKAMPFNLSDAKEAAWDHFKGGKKHPSDSIYEKAAKNLDEPYTILEDFSKELYSCKSRADIKVKQVIRRYVEEDRDVVIWISHVAPAEIKHKMLRGLTYHLRGYALTKRSQASTPECEVSQLQFCSLISLDQEHGTMYDSVNARMLINFLIGNTVHNIRNHQELIESALIDRALT